MHDIVLKNPVLPVTLPAEDVIFPVDDIVPFVVIFPVDDIVPFVVTLPVEVIPHFSVQTPTHVCSHTESPPLFLINHSV